MVVVVAWHTKRACAVRRRVKYFTSATNLKALVLTTARPIPLAARPRKPVSSDADVRSSPLLVRRPLVLARKGITSGSPNDAAAFDRRPADACFF